MPSNTENVIDNILFNLKTNNIPEEYLGIIEEYMEEELDKYTLHTQEEVRQLLVEPLAILDQYCAQRLLEGRAQSTIDIYKEVNGHFLKYVGKGIQDINHYDVRAYLAYKSGNGNSKTYLALIRSVLCSFFAWLTIEEYIIKNPMLKIAPIKGEDKIRRKFSSVDIDKLRRNCHTARDLAVVDFLLSTGCRVSEACSVTLSDVDLSKKTVIVLGKGSKYRTVYLTDVCVESLREYLEHRRYKSIYLFTELYHDKKITTGGVRALCKRLEKESGVANVHPHRFRRTCCSNLLAKGMYIQDVARILGHAKLDTTNVYNDSNETQLHANFELRNI